jgi:hypothetical protein
MADATLRAVITARDEASRAFKSVSASLQKIGVDAEKANEITRRAFAQGADLKGLKQAEASLKKLGLSSDQARRMMAEAGLDVKKLGDGAAKSGVQWQSLGKTVSGVGSKMMMATAFIAAPLLAGGAALIKLAMNAEETRNLFAVSMGDMAGAADQWVSQMNTLLGLNKTALQQNLGMWQSMFTAMGIGKQAALGMGEGLTALAYDMSSFYNLAPDVMFEKLRSGISGEIEPLKQLGIVVDDASVKNWALTNGLITQGDEMSAAQKTVARYNLILQQTANAQGDLARTMTSPANQLRLLQERVTALGTEIGQGLMPIASSALSWLNEQGLPRVRQAVNNFGQSWVEMSETAKRRVIAVAALLVAGGPLMKGIGIAIQGIGKLSAAFHLLSIVAKNKVAQVATALTLVGAGVLMTYNQIADAVNAFGDSMASVGASLVGTGIPGVVQMGDALQKTGSAMKASAVDIRGYWDGVQNSMADTVGQIEDEGLKAFDSLLTSTEALGAQNLAEWARGFDEAIGYTGASLAQADEQMRALSQGATALAPYTAPKIDKAAWDALAGPGGALDEAGKKAKEAGISVADLTQALVAQSAITRTAAVAVSYWESQIEATNLAIEANRDQLQAAQSELSRMQDHLSELNDELTVAKQKFDEFTHPTLSGMGAFADSIFEAEQAIKRLQLAELNWQIAGGVGDSPFKAQIEAAQRDLQRLQLEQSLTFDPQMRSLDKLANPQTEMTYQEAAAGIQEWGARVADLTKAVEVQEKAIKGQEAVVKSIQAAADALNKTLAIQQEQLELARGNFENVTKALTAAFTWFISDREEIRKMGPAGVEASDQVDEATKALLLGLTGFAADNTTTAQKNIAQMVKDYEDAVNRIKAMLNGVGGPGVPSIGAATGGGDQFRAVVDGRVVYDGPSQNAAENAYNAAGGGAFGDGNVVEKHDYPGPAYAGRPYGIGVPEVFIPKTDGWIQPIGGAKVGGGDTIIHIHVAGSVLTERDLVHSVRRGLLEVERDNGGRVLR